MNESWAMAFTAMRDDGVVWRVKGRSMLLKLKRRGEPFLWMVLLGRFSEQQQQQHCIYEEHQYCMKVYHSLHRSRCSEICPVMIPIATV